MIKALIFDKDGTLFDFQSSWGPWTHGFLTDLADGDPLQMQAMAQASGFDLDRQIFLPDSKMIAGTAEEGAATLLPFRPGETLESLTAFLIEASVDVPMTEVVPLAPYLSGLKGRGLSLGIATNDAERPARAQLDAVGAAALFDFIAGYDSGHGGKPAPGQLTAFADQTGIPAGEIAMVGDSTHDLLAGRAAQMQTIAVLTGVAGHAELEPHADVVLDSIADIPNWMDEKAL